jgi:electron transfer flavoprotein beta subunit
MKILVLVKQVPQSESDIRIDQSSAWILTEKSTTFRMNRFDESAVEEALLIRESHSDAKVDVLSVGPERAAMAVKRALGMGADHGIHILTGNGGYQSPLTIASLIASYAADKKYDLIMAGVMAEDSMQGQVGPMTAELLSLPCATSVVLEKIESEKGSVYVEREIEGGLRDALELNLPAVLTIQTGINKPRYPSLSNILRAKKQDLEIISESELEQLDPREDILKAHYPQKARAGVVLEGSQQEKAVQLLKMLREKSLI